VKPIIPLAAATHGRGLFTSTDLALDVEDNTLAVKTSGIRIYPTISDGNINIYSRVNSEKLIFLFTMLMVEMFIIRLLTW